MSLTCINIQGVSTQIGRCHKQLHLVSFFMDSWNIMHSVYLLHNIRLMYIGISHCVLKF